MSARATWLPRPWRATIRDEWIDYNGHLRDACYALLASEAVDDLMEQVGLDRAYRAATGGTLYTLEMHLHFLREVKQGETVTLVLTPLALDARRLHLRCDLNCAGLDRPAAVVEMLLLHVRQSPAPKAAPFPEPVARRLRDWLTGQPAPEDGYCSRAMGLRRVGGGS